MCSQSLQSVLERRCRGIGCWILFTDFSERDRRLPEGRGAFPWGHRHQHAWVGAATCAECVSSDPSAQTRSFRHGAPGAGFILFVGFLLPFSMEMAFVVFSGTASAGDNRTGWQGAFSRLLPWDSRLREVRQVTVFIKIGKCALWLLFSLHQSKWKC